MSNQQFSVLYNGHSVAVSRVDDDKYLVQVTYKPLHIQMKVLPDGTEQWIEEESQQETFVSQQLGDLISAHLCTA